MNQIVIEESKLQHNIDIIKDKIKNIVDDKGNPLKIIAVLKGNAYGMGIQNVAQKLLDNNIDFFAVTEVDEAIELRTLGFDNEILILNSTCIREDIERIVDNNLTATIGSIDALTLLDDVAKDKQKRVKYHLKIDTGFCRFGIDSEKICESKDFLDLLKHEIESKKNVDLCGTYSHFQESYAKDEKTTRNQFKKFLNTIAKLKSVNINPGILHICNSSAFFKYREMYMNAVRIGSAFSGRLQISNSTGLQRLGYLESNVCEIKEVKKGSKVGYSGTHKLKKNTKIAVVEAGYFDGIGLSGPKDSVRLIDKLRVIKNGIMLINKNGTRYATINEKKYPILGRIGMKNFMIDISDTDIEVGTKVKIDINLMLANQKIKRVLK